MKRSFGFDNPDFLSSGPRDVMVNAGDAQRAKDLLAETMIEDEGDEIAELEGERRLARGETGGPSPARLAFWILPSRPADSSCSGLLYDWRRRSEWEIWSRLRSWGTSSRRR